MLPAFFIALAVSQASSGKPVDWVSIIQTPYRKLPHAINDLRPLLVAPDGKPISTRDEWAKARQAIVDSWRARLGSPPERPKELDVRVEKSENLGNYTRRLLSFAGDSDDRIRVYVIIPAGIQKGQKRPAVAVFHPTTTDTLREPVGLGKRPDMALALQLTRRGYITLSPECYILKGKGALAQAGELARQRPGWTGMGKMTFDASRCVDFLETLPAVDAGRIGCIGHSLGAKEVLYAMAFEPRYRVGVFNEGGIGLRMSNWTDPWYLTEAMKPHIPAQEHHQLLALIAPRPFLILGGDSADGDASWSFIESALPVYRLLGAGDRMGLVNHKGKHSFPAEAREVAYRWLDYWLKYTPEK
jgi:dienelactone hydrolase